MMHGVVDTGIEGRRTDYLFRVTIKAFIVNENEQILVVKEAGRTWWDLPGGGMDHGESVKQCLARELREEVCMAGNFTYDILDVDDAKELPHSNIMQMRLVLWVIPENMIFDTGVDSDEIAFLPLSDFDDDEYKREKFTNYINRIKLLRKNK